MLYRGDQFLSKDRCTLDKIAVTGLLVKDDQGDYFVHQDTPAEIKMMVQNMSSYTTQEPNLSTSSDLVSVSSSMTISSEKKTLALSDRELFKQYKSGYDSIRADFERLKEAFRDILECKHEPIVEILSVTLHDKLSLGSIERLGDIYSKLQEPVSRFTLDTNFDIQIAEMLQKRFVMDIQSFLQDYNIQEYYNAYEHIRSSLNQYFDLDLSAKYVHPRWLKSELQEVVYNIQISNYNHTDDFTFKLFGEIQSFENAVNNSLE